MDEVLRFWSGYGKISAARALEVSSNIGLATIIDDHYSKQPEKFLKRLRYGA